MKKADVSMGNLLATGWRKADESEILSAAVHPNSGEARKVYAPSPSLSTRRWRGRFHQAASLPQPAIDRQVHSDGDESQHQLYGRAHDDDRQ